MSGTAAKWNDINNTTAATIKANRAWLSAHLKLLNFRAKNRKGDTISSEKTTVMDTKTNSCNTHEPGVNTNGNDVMKSVFDGVFRPLNESLCVSSTLNIAKRSAANAAIINAT